MRMENLGNSIENEMENLGKLSSGLVEVVESFSPAAKYTSYCKHHNLVLNAI